ncbi:MAG: hypothetical protein WCR52_02035 [Bacteroidota bacterium]
MRPRLALLLLLIFSLQQVSCVYYQRYPMAKSRLNKIDTKYLTFFLIDNAHPLTKAWEVKSYDIDEKSMFCAMSALSEKDAHDVVTVRNNADARASKNEVLLFLKPEFAKTLTDTGSTTVHFDQIDRIEVYETNFGKTIAVFSMGYLAIGLTAAVIALISEGSCPFIYADNPDGVSFQGEMYSGATYPQLERHDWLPLPGLHANGSEYRIRIANEAKEIQHTNVLELMTLDHPVGTEVLIDKYGTLQSISNPIQATEALDFEGHTALPALSACDTSTWRGDIKNKRPEATEGLMLRFPKPVGAKTGKLILRAKNTFWMDYMYGQFLDEFGTYADFVHRRYLQKSKEELKSWIDDQHVPLQVSLETSPGKWEKVEDFNLAGPMALKKDVLELNLANVSGNEVRIKLESGFLFWEIDYVAMDYSAPQAVTTHVLSPLSAITQTGVDMAGALLSDDDQYYSQPEIGDVATVRYPVPPQAPGTERSLILHAKGHYEILRDPVHKTPNLRTLKKFQKPNALPNYSRELWLQLPDTRLASRIR